MTVLMSSAYWPNLQYLQYVLNAENVLIEAHEHYGKQSYRNRCVILSANGPLDLSIPVKKLMSNKLISEVEISYKENWPCKHWRAIQSAYNNSPYFEYFEQDIKLFYETEFKNLLSYNTEQLRLILKLLRLTNSIGQTTQFEKMPEGLLDLRDSIHPKKESKADAKVGELLSRPYYQTFGTRFGFVPNLSVLDLLFNKGLESIDYLKIIP